MDITYLVKQNGTVKVIAENYKYSRTPHAAHKELWNTSFVCLKICEDPTLNPRDEYTNMHSKLLVKIVFVN